MNEEVCSNNCQTWGNVLSGVTSYNMFPSQAKLGFGPENVGHSLLDVDRTDAAVGKHHS